MYYGYIRVSTDKQTVENQRFEITNFCKKEGIKIDAWIEETISGCIEVDKRKLGQLLQTMKKGDVLICAELSRLGRTLMMIMTILNHCLNNEMQVWSIKDNYRLGQDINSKVLAFAFGLSAEIERNLISQRTKEALHRKKMAGCKLGRPMGSRNRTSVLKSNLKDIIQMMANGEKLKSIAKKYEVAPRTVRRFWMEHTFQTA